MLSDTLTPILRGIGLLAAILIPAYGVAQDNPSPSMESELQLMARYSGFNEPTGRQLLKLGPSAVPVITTMLIREAKPNQKRQLICMLGHALSEMTVPDGVKQSAIDTLYEQLQSIDEPVRWMTLHVLPRLEGSKAIDRLLPLLDDNVEDIRCIAAEQLAKIGDATTPAAIEAVMKRRSRGLSEEQVRNDYSFRFGYQAIEELRRKYPARAGGNSTEHGSVKQIPVIGPSTVGGTASGGASDTKHLMPDLSPILSERTKQVSLSDSVWVGVGGVLLLSAAFLFAYRQRLRARKRQSS